MSTTGGVAESTGWDEHAARSWIERGTKEEAYAAPWSLAVAVAATAPPAGDFVVLDAASGPGGFLAIALELVPAATGIWFDNFVTMEETARRNLAPFGARVEFRVGDLTALSSAAPDASASIVTCSRATHHLDDDGLARFYAEAFRVLAPGGWVANLDSVTPPGAWREPLRAARRYLNPSPVERERDPNHPKGHPHSYEDHLGAAQAAGFRDLAPIWRVGQHSLIMGRKPT